MEQGLGAIYRLLQVIHFVVLFVRILALSGSQMP